MHKEHQELAFRKAQAHKALRLFEFAKGRQVESEEEVRTWLMELLDKGPIEPDEIDYNAALKGQTTCNADFLAIATDIMPNSTKVRVTRTDYATGWVCFKVLTPEASPVARANAIESAFVKWMTGNKFTVKQVLPIVANGSTTAIHVWFE